MKSRSSCNISIHALRGEGDQGGNTARRRRQISIHALRGEGDAAILALVIAPPHFYPRPPWGGRLTPKSIQNTLVTISIHALRGEGDFHRHVSVDAAVLFLSTPSVGRATQPGSGNKLFGEDFYPRPPWGGRPLLTISSFVQVKFLSTPSVGRATKRAGNGCAMHGISIHALRGEGDYGKNLVDIDQEISIHALRGEGDAVTLTMLFPFLQFLSTPSVGRATGSDPGTAASHSYFYPRPLWGGRRAAAAGIGQTQIFLSTPSVGRATSAFSRYILS